MRRGGPLWAALEFVVWWAVLGALWLALIISVEGRAQTAGIGCAAAGALAVTATRRAVVAR
ncbi:hypothetical protein [Streptomyces sp. NPDC006552]|uniref:hypothetical protein n=1 Tax=Streptomyces sp. NPDC006552 TaxID=3157179 RepID=UPI0033A67079